MHDFICKLSSDEFYDSKLRTGIPENSRPLPRSMFPRLSPAKKGKIEERMMFIECAAMEDLGNKLKGNQGQAKLCYEVCKLLNNHASPVKATVNAPLKSQENPPSVAVLTSYSRQVLLLRSMLAQ